MGDNEIWRRVGVRTSASRLCARARVQAQGVRLLTLRPRSRADVQTVLYGPIQEWTMVAPGKIDLVDGQRIHSVHRLDGLRVPFEQAEWRSDDVLLDQKRLYYMPRREAERPIELLPFLRIDLASDPSSPVAYFYSKRRGDEIHWVSYHAESSNRSKTVDSRVRSLIQELTPEPVRSVRRRPRPWAASGADSSPACRGHRQDRQDHRPVPAKPAMHGLAGDPVPEGHLGDRHPL